MPAMWSLAQEASWPGGEKTIANPKHVFGYRRASAAGAAQGGLFLRRTWNISWSTTGRDEGKAFQKEGTACLRCGREDAGFGSGLKL